MAETSITPRPTTRDRAASAVPARTGRVKPVVRRDLAPARNRDRWIETAYMSEIGAQLDRQVRAAR